MNNARWLNYEAEDRTDPTRYNGICKLVVRS